LAGDLDVIAFIAPDLRGTSKIIKALDSGMISIIIGFAIYHANSGLEASGTNSKESQSSRMKSRFL
jgi:hypothetical protein